MAQVLYEAGETATLRADAPVHRWATRRPWPTLRNAGAGYFKVPKVIER